MALLRRWRSKYGPLATYGKLAECLYNAGKPGAVEVICKVLQANGSIPQPAAMQTSLAYSNTQTNPIPQQQPVQPNLWMTGGRLMHYTNINHILNYMQLLYSMQPGMPHHRRHNTLNTPTNIQLVLPISQHILNHRTPATLHNQANTDLSKVIAPHNLVCSMTEIYLKTMQLI